MATQTRDLTPEPPSDLKLPPDFLWGFATARSFLPSSSSSNRNHPYYVCILLTLPSQLPDRRRHRRGRSRPLHLGRLLQDPRQDRRRQLRRRGVRLVPPHRRGHCAAQVHRGQGVSVFAVVVSCEQKLGFAVSACSLFHDGSLGFDAPRGPPLPKQLRGILSPRSLKFR